MHRSLTAKACQQVAVMAQAGAKPTHLELPAQGIHGNTRVSMLDDNSDQNSTLMPGSFISAACGTSINSPRIISPRRAACYSSRVRGRPNFKVLTQGLSSLPAAGPIFLAEDKAATLE
jgi:hypothetical protein